MSRSTNELRWRFPDIEVDNLNMCWVQTGPYRSRVGHIMNAHRVVQKGEMISVNPYAIIGGYYHVLERSLYWGHIPDDALAVFKTNVEAHHAGLRTLRAGIKCSDVDKAVNSDLPRSRPPGGPFLRHRPLGRDYVDLVRARGGR